MRKKSGCGCSMLNGGKRKLKKKSSKKTKKSKCRPLIGLSLLEDYPLLNIMPKHKKYSKKRKKTKRKNKNKKRTKSRKR